MHSKSWFLYLEWWFEYKRLAFDWPAATDDYYITCEETTHGGSGNLPSNVKTAAMNHFLYCFALFSALFRSILRETLPLWGSIPSLSFHYSRFITLILALLLSHTNPFIIVVLICSLSSLSFCCVIITAIQLGARSRQVNWWIFH